MQGLTDDKEYKFRVAAVNSNGVGDWLYTTSSIIAKYPFGKITKYSMCFVASWFLYIFFTFSLFENDLW